MKTQAEPELSVERIAQITADFNRKRYAVTQELAEIFASESGGAPVEAPITEHAASVRTRAAILMNGHAPAGLKLPVPVSRKAELEVECAAIDLVLTAYSQQEIVARNNEAERFAMQNAPEWLKICRDEIVDAVRATARQTRAVAWRQNLGGVVPTNLPLARYVGHGRPLGGGELSRAIVEALELKIISKSELREAENAPN